MMRYRSDKVRLLVQAHYNVQYRSPSPQVQCRSKRVNQAKRGLARTRKDSHGDQSGNLRGTSPVLWWGKGKALSPLSFCTVCKSTLETVSAPFYVYEIDTMESIPRVLMMNDKPDKPDKAIPLLQGNSNSSPAPVFASETIRRRPSFNPPRSLTEHYPHRHACSCLSLKIDLRWAAQYQSPNVILAAARCALLEGRQKCRTGPVHSHDSVRESRLTNKSLQGVFANLLRVLTASASLVQALKVVSKVEEEHHHCISLAASLASLASLHRRTPSTSLTG